MGENDTNDKHNSEEDIDYEGILHPKPQGYIEMNDLLTIALLCKRTYIDNLELNEFPKLTFKYNPFSKCTQDDFQCKFIEYGEGDTELYAFISQSHVILCFRGSDSITDWMYNFCGNGCMQPSFLKADSKVRIYSGFLNKYMKIRGYLMELFLSFEDKNILLCGHSLGAALASIACLDIGKNFQRPGGQFDTHLVTFGSPLVGNLDFVNEIEDLSTLALRCVNDKDIVTKMPSFRGNFAHMNKPLVHLKHTRRKEYYDDYEKSRSPFFRTLSVLLFHTRTCFRLNAINDHLIENYIKELGLMKPGDYTTLTSDSI
jgi:hypothetical protein